MRQSKPPASAHKENALKITLFLGVASRFLSSRGDCSGRRGLWSGCSWGALRRSFAVSRSWGREVQDRLRLLSHLARKWGFSLCSGRALRCGASLRRCWSRGTELDSEVRLVLSVEHAADPWPLIPQLQLSQTNEPWKVRGRLSDRAPLTAQARVWQVGCDLGCFRFPRASPAPAPPHPYPAPWLGGARARVREGAGGEGSPARSRGEPRAPAPALAPSAHPVGPAQPWSRRSSSSTTTGSRGSPSSTSLTWVFCRRWSGRGGVVGCRQRPQGNPLMRAAALLAPRPPRGPGLSASGWVWARCPPLAALLSSDVALPRQLLRASVAWAVSRQHGEALETSRSRALACRATAAHLRPRAHWLSCLPAARGFC